MLKIADHRVFPSINQQVPRQGKAENATMTSLVIIALNVGQRNSLSNLNEAKQCRKQGNKKKIGEEKKRSKCKGTRRQETGDNDTEERK